MSDWQSDDSPEASQPVDYLAFLDWCFYCRGMRDTTQTTTPIEEWEAWRADCYRGGRR